MPARTGPRAPASTSALALAIANSITLTLAFVLASACNESTPSQGTGASTGGNDDAPSSGADDDDDPDGDGSSAAPDTSAPGDASDPDPSDPSSADGLDGGDSDGDGPPPANEPNLPSISGVCPDFFETLAFQDTHDLMFAPDGRTPRSVRLFMDANAMRLDGPLVFYWHGTGGETNEAFAAFGEPAIDMIRAAGGIVAAPTPDPASGTFPWQPVGGNLDHDNILADEILACAIDQVGVDVHRIHSAGFSAGGMHTAAMSVRRAAYLASVISFSGGEFGPVLALDTDPDNLFAGMVVHGGPTDVYGGGVSFQEPSEHYAELLQMSGRFALLCDHGQGHHLPNAPASAMQFLMDHPWGASPSPYENGLPGVFPDGYCVIP